jgi:hypothetical protein
MLQVTPLSIFNTAMPLIGENQASGVPVANITAATIASGSLKFTVDSSSSILVGQTVYVSGTLTSLGTWDGYYIVTSVPDSTHIWVAAPDAATYTSGGTITWAYPYDGNKNSTTFNALWPQKILGWTLGLAPWNALKVRVPLNLSSLTVTTGTANGTTVTLTVGNHKLVVGQTIYVSGTVVSSSQTWDGTYLITAVTATTISFANTITGTYVSGGVVTWAPVFEFSYVYDLPTDGIRYLKVNSVSISNYYQYTTHGNWYQYGQSMPPFRIEGSHLLTSEITCDLQYLQYDNVFYSPPQDNGLISLLIDKTAWTVSLGLNRDAQVINTLKADFTTAFIREKLINSQQGTPEELQESSWITTRF